MPTPRVCQHPNHSTLVAYAQGRLPEDRTNVVGRHLESCAKCRAVVDTAPADSFITQIRAGQPGRGTAPTPPPRVGSTPGPIPGPAVDMEELPGELRSHPKYRVLRLLGRGGMGVVYLAHHALMDRLVALKVIRRALLGQGDALDRFYREVRAAARLDHPNIVRAYDSEQVGDVHLLAMEYVDGKSLACLVSRDGPVPVTRACQFIRQAAVGLQHAHEQGMVHRDLKPDNLMVTPAGAVKILDFGLAKLAGGPQTGRDLTRSRAAIGTPEFMAPEQVVDTRSADTRADIYALGCTLFYLLTGRPPFPADDGGVMPVLNAHLKVAPPRVTGLRPDVPGRLADLIERMLAKDPSGRPQTARDVADALSTVAPQPNLHVKGHDSEAVEPARATWLVGYIVCGFVAAAVVAAVALSAILGGGRPGSLKSDALSRLEARSHGPPVTKTLPAASPVAPVVALQSPVSDVAPKVAAPPPEPKADEPPAMAAKDPVPEPRVALPSIKGASDAHKTACQAAKTRLIAAFHDEIQSAQSQQRARDEKEFWLNVERKRFEKDRLIPWSKAMRPHLLQYLKAVRTADEQLESVYEKYIAVERSHQLVAPVVRLRNELANRLNAHRVAIWCGPSSNPRGGDVEFYSNGRVGSVNGEATWEFVGDKVKLTWVPGHLVDTFTPSADGKKYSGKNNSGASFSGTIE